MIGFVRGKLIEKQPPQLLVDVNGIGYELQAPMSTFFNLAAVGEDVFLHTHLQVREDAHTLYAFGSQPERRLFKTLLKVNGVGAKLALAILSGMSVDEFVICVSGSDTAGLTRLPGIGKKTAERLIVEMRDRLADWHEEGGVATGSVPQLAGAAGKVTDPVHDAVQALVALGYKPTDASRMVRSMDTAGLAVEDIVRNVLQGLVK